MTYLVKVRAMVRTAATAATAPMDTGTTIATSKVGTTRVTIAMPIATITAKTGTSDAGTIALAVIIDSQE
ncbi:hypothetical protein JI59_23290 (plasmid) [Novosphingobium pentaromativorans US6-1]|jgi:hypothetical protein|nr:hypothetical protein JI59_23290 [Novosphingobium pentaromativorans US6-1]